MPIGDSVAPANAPQTITLQKFLPSYLLQRQWVHTNANQKAPLVATDRTALAFNDLGDEIQTTIKAGSAASPTNPQTWSTFEQAAAAAERVGGQIGFVFANGGNKGFADHDLYDANRINPKTGKAFPKAKHATQEIVDSINADLQLAFDLGIPVERSVSGYGFHFYFSGVCIGDGHNTSNVEIYSRERFVIHTAKWLKSAQVILNADNLLTYAIEYATETPKEADETSSKIFVEHIFNKYDLEKTDKYSTESISKNNLTYKDYSKIKKNLAEEKFLEKVFSAKTGNDTKKLFEGDEKRIGADHSAACYELINTFCFFNKDNPNDELVKNCFYLSALADYEKPKGVRKYHDRADSELLVQKMIDKCRTERGVDIKELLNIDVESIERHLKIKAAQKAAQNGVGQQGETVSTANLSLYRNEKIKSETEFQAEIKSDFFPVYGIEEIIKQPKQKWLVEDILPESGIASIFGPSASGKSFLALHFAAQLATQGQEYIFSHRIEPQPIKVVYAAFEGFGTMQSRYEALKIDAIKTGKPAPNLFTIDGTGRNLLDNDQFDLFVSQLKSVIAANEMNVIIIDTLAACAPAMEENNSKDMGALITRFNQLQAELGGLVVLIHHTGKDLSKGMRGWSGLFAAMDAAILVDRSPVDLDLRQWTATKVKNGHDGAKHEFNLKSVFIGKNNFGNDCFSCVVQSTFIEKTQEEKATDETVATEIIALIRTAIESGEKPSGRYIEKNKKQHWNLSQRGLKKFLESMRTDGQLQTGGTAEHPHFEINQTLFDN